MSRNAHICCYFNRRSIIGYMEILDKLLEDKQRKKTYYRENERTNYWNNKRYKTSV